MSQSLIVEKAKVSDLLDSNDSLPPPILNLKQVNKDEEIMKSLLKKYLMNTEQQEGIFSTEL